MLTTAMFFVGIVCFLVGLKLGKNLTKYGHGRASAAPIDLLKNALLTTALNDVFRPKNLFDDWNMDYNSFDGSKLPAMSGYSAENVCFTYIQEPQDLAREPFATRTMIDKARAIEKFIDCNLSSEAQVLDFFSQYMDTKDRKKV